MLFIVDTNSTFFQITWMILLDYTRLSWFWYHHFEQENLEKFQLGI